MTPIAILILAAGASSRMGGRDKLMQDAGGAPLLARVLERAVDTRRPVLVTVPDTAHPRAELARRWDVALVPVPDRAEGMAASIRAGVAALPPGTGAVMILPGDMPDLTTGDLCAMADRHAGSPDTILRATSGDGRPGHPVIFPADLFKDLGRLSGDTGARAVIAAHADRVMPHRLPGDHAICDLDTPQHWARWRARPR